MCHRTPPRALPSSRNWTDKTYPIPGIEALPRKISLSVGQFKSLPVLPCRSCVRSYMQCLIAFGGNSLYKIQSTTKKLPNFWGMSMYLNCTLRWAANITQNAVTLVAISVNFWCYCRLSITSCSVSLIIKGIHNIKIKTYPQKYPN